MSVQQIVEAGRIAPAQLTGKSWKIKVIEGDRQGSSAYYPKEVLEAGKGLFKKGLRIYKNHPSSEEKWSRPERNIDDIIGWFSEDATYEGKDLFANVQFVESEQARIKELAEAGVIGMSIRAEGQMTEGTNGMELSKFTAVHSVDVVTTAGAGGGFEKLLESDRKVSASESVAESEKKEEIRMDKELATALDALVESNKTATAALTPLVEAVGKLVARADAEDKAKADALAEAAKPAEVDPLEVAKQLAESGLAPAAQARVLDAVKGGKELAESITAEKDYAKSLVEAAGKTFVGHETTELNESKVSIGANIFGG